MRRTWGLPRPSSARVQSLPHERGASSASAFSAALCPPRLPAQVWLAAHEAALAEGASDEGGGSGEAGVRARGVLDRAVAALPRRKHVKVGARLARAQCWLGCAGPLLRGPARHAGSEQGGRVPTGWRACAAWHVVGQAVVQAARSSSPHCPLQVITAAAMHEFSCAGGSMERGRGVLEGLLRNYPKRTDLWSLYLDQVWAGSQGSRAHVQSKHAHAARLDATTPLSRPTRARRVHVCAGDQGGRRRAHARAV